MNTTKSKRPEAYIYGAGSGGKCALSYYEDNFEILGFIDSDTKKSGQKLEDLTIFSPDTLKSNTTCSIIIASEYAEQIREFLTKTLKISADRIIEASPNILKAMMLEDPAQLKIAHQLMQLVAEMLDRENIPYHLESGTLLGLCRDGQLIPWDNDVDLAVDGADVERILKAGNSLLPTIKSVTGVDYYFEEFYAEYPFGAIPTGVVRSLKFGAFDATAPSLDLFCRYSDEELVYWSLASRGMTAPKESFYNRSTIHFNGYDYKTPANVDQYLTNMYGDWRTPKKDWAWSAYKNITVF